MHFQPVVKRNRILKKYGANQFDFLKTKNAQENEGENRSATFKPERRFRKTFIAALVFSQLYPEIKH